MRALGFSVPGGPEVLSIVDVPMPVPAAGQVRIRVAFAAVNPTDLLLRANGAAIGLTGSPPWVAGMDVAGHVDDAPGIDDLAAGDPVMAVVVPVWAPNGAQAEYVVVPRASVVPMPAGMAMEVAAALPMNALTAQYALDRLDLPPGATLAVSGGAGLLASYLIPMARHRDLQLIADAADADRPLVASFGAGTIVPRGPAFGSRVRDVRPEGVDALVDTAVLGDEALGAVRDGGRVIAVREWTGGQERDIRVESIRVRDYATNQAALLDIRSLAEQGVLVPRVIDVIDLERGADAHRLVARGGLRGRIVLRVDSGIS